MQCSRRCTTKQAKIGGVWAICCHRPVCRRHRWGVAKYRAYWNSERCHQGIDGQTPVERADSARVADVPDLSELRRRKLVRQSFAHGPLNSYSLEPVAEAA
jgi:hypothetical protein